MLEGFSLQAVDFLTWALVGLLAGFVSGLVVRNGPIHLTDGVLGVLGAILGGVLAELLWGMRTPLNEQVVGVMMAFFAAVVLTLILRLAPCRFAESEEVEASRRGRLAR